MTSPPRRRRALARRTVILPIAGMLAYLAAAYVVTPAFWSHHNHQPGLAGKPMVTVTAQGNAGDPINIGLIGSRDEIIAAMTRAGWASADPVTSLSSVRIIESVVFNRAYATAPVSPLFYEGKRQALAFQKAEGISARRRHHVRFWPTLADGVEGRPVWLGAASFDRAVGISHYTGQITHHVAPDLDAERDLIIADLTGFGVLATIYQVSGIGPTAVGRNGGGDAYFTDGEITVGVLTARSRPQGGAPETLPNPPVVAAKNSLWSAGIDLGRRLHLVPEPPKAEDVPLRGPHRVESAVPP